MIPEREREALMRLTMCAREECGMCKHKYTCNFDFQYELATKSMNILAEALRKTDPQTCDTCKFADKEWYEEPCDRCGYMGKYEPKTEPQYDIDKGTIKCDNCSESGSYKCSKCDGEMYFKRLEIEDEPQTEVKVEPTWVGVTYGRFEDEPHTERSDR